MTYPFLGLFVILLALFFVKSSHCTCNSNSKSKSKSFFGGDGYNVITLSSADHTKDALNPYVLPFSILTATIVLIVILSLGLTGNFPSGGGRIA